MMNKILNFFKWKKNVINTIIMVIVWYCYNKWYIGTEEFITIWAVVWLIFWTTSFATNKMINKQIEALKVEKK